MFTVSSVYATEYTKSYRRIALLFPDWLLAPSATRNLKKYMDTVVDKTLSLSDDELRNKAEKEMTLMEALAIKKPQRKVY
jgi:hypothetical protein